MFFYCDLSLGLKPESAVWSQGVGLTAIYFGKTKFVGKDKIVCAPECKDHSGLQKVGGWLRQSHWNEKMMFYQSR